MIILPSKLLFIMETILRVIPFFEKYHWFPLSFLQHCSGLSWRFTSTHQVIFSRITEISFLNLSRPNGYILHVGFLVVLTFPPDCFEWCISLASKLQIHFLLIIVVINKTHLSYWNCCWMQHGQTTEAPCCMEVSSTSYIKIIYIYYYTWSKCSACYQF